VNKCGYQFQTIGDAQRQMLRATYPHTLKMLQGGKSLELAIEWKIARLARGLPGVLVLRYVTSDKEPLSEVPALTATALRAFEGFQTLAGAGIAVVLEVPVNERFHTDPADFAALAEVSTVAAAAIKHSGFTPGVLVTSEGNPPGESYGAPYFLQPRVLACLLTFRALGAVWCPHGYSHPPSGSEDEWHSTRPAQILAQLPEPARLNYLYGEDGCDGGTQQTDRRPGRGWRDYFGPAGDYATWYRAKSHAIAADPLCVGSAIFLCGADPASKPSWDSFDIGDELDLRGVFTEDVPGPQITWLPTTPSTPPAPAPTPAPTKPIPASPGKDSSMTDVVLSCPHREAPAFYQSEQEGNYSKQKRAKTVGCVIHSTAGGSSSLAAETAATANWFGSREAGVSAHRVVGPTEVVTCVPDDLTAYHARENNADHLGVEFAMPDGAAWTTAIYPDVYYEAGGELLARWAQKYKFPLRWVTDQTQPGLITHKDSAAGKRDGRRDPTGSFDRARLLASALAWQTRIGGTPVVTPPKPVPKPPAFDYEASAWGPIYRAHAALQATGDQADAGLALTVHNAVVLHKLVKGNA